MSQDELKGTIAQNKKARHNYFIGETFEAGLALIGSEVKSLRLGKANIEEAHAAESNGELYVFNMHITEYLAAKHFGHEARRPRKLLLKKREINKILGSIQRKGFTLVPLTLYFNKRGKVKMTLGLAEGKKLHDKRHAIKERDWNRDKQRLLKQQ